MRLHRDVDPDSRCGGQVATAQELFKTDYWCVYCGAKFDASDEYEARRADAEADMAHDRRESGD